MTSEYNEIELSYRNISSVRQFAILDLLLHVAVANILDRTTFIQSRIAQLLVYQFRHKKRKISPMWGWKEAISSCCNFLQDPRIETFIACRLDRGYQIAIIDDFLLELDKYDLVYSKSMIDEKFHQSSIHVLEEYHKRIELNTGLDCFQLYSTIKYVRGMIRKHKNTMIGSYGLYMKKCAHSMKNSVNLPIDVDDLINNLFRAASKAVDHFDVSKGAFKSYLDIWLKKIFHGGSHFYGSAYRVPQGVEANHLYVDIDTLEEPENDGINTGDPEQSLIEDQKNADIRYIIEYLDPNRLCPELHRDIVN